MSTPIPSSTNIPSFPLACDCSPGHAADLLKRLTLDYESPITVTVPAVLRPNKFVLWDASMLPSQLDALIRCSPDELKHTRFVGLMAKHFGMLGLIVGVVQQVGTRQYYFDFYHPASRKLIRVFTGDDIDASHIFTHPDRFNLLILIDSDGCAAKGKKKVTTGGVLHRPLKKLWMEVAEVLNAYVIDGDEIWKPAGSSLAKRPAKKTGMVMKE